MTDGRLFPQARRPGLLAVAFVMVFLAIALPAQSDPALTPQEQTIADTIVSDVLGGRTEGVRVVLTPALPADTRVEFLWSGGELSAPQGTRWLGIADDTPWILGYHPVWQVFVDDALSIIEVRRESFFPRVYVNGQRQRYTTLIQYVAKPGIPPADRQLVPQPEAGFAGAFSYQNHYAVLIEGDTPGGPSYYGEFWTDNVRLYRILLEYGWQDDHIHVLYGEGSDETTWPCDYYRETMVDFPAYKQDVRNIFTWMKDGNAVLGIDQVTSQDFIFLFTFDHGSSSGACNASLCLMDGCMADTEFASYFNAIAYQHRAVDMQQCNSGGFIDNLQNATTVISTAANCTESAWEANETDPCGAYSTYYGEWNYWWMSAMEGHKPWPGEGPVTADTNGNGTVSFLEAHNYALANDSANEHPMWSDPGGLGDQLGLATTCGNGICDPSETTCSCPGDCGGHPSSEVMGSTCTDGLDNDCDAKADCADSDCAKDPACCKASGSSCTTNADCCSRKCVGKAGRKTCR